MSEPKFGICEECNQENTGNRWCKECNSKRFQKNFKNWTSKNGDIDRFIQHTQLSANNSYEILEWIPYDRLYDIKYIAEGGFGNVYRTKWIDGYIEYWDNMNKIWIREEQNKFAALKSLNNSKNVTLEFINEITLHHKLNGNLNFIRFYGITHDPETKNYMMVLQYAENGSLRNYLDINKGYDNYSWYDRISDLCNIISGLNTIHNNELVHRDLNIGNILKTSDSTYIASVGLCRPEDYNNTEKKVYGVLPYVAPEVLKGQNYTKASDIYSFGIIMYEVISGLPPYDDASHDENLAIKICQGLRPKFNIKVPQLIVNLIKRCLDENPLNRSTAYELRQILLQWYNELHENKQTEIQKQIEEAASNSSTSGLLYDDETHTEAI